MLNSIENFEEFCKLDQKVVFQGNVDNPDDFVFENEGRKISHASSDKAWAIIILPADDPLDVVSFHIVMDKGDQNQMKGYLSLDFAEKEVLTTEIRFMFDGRIEEWDWKKDKAKTVAQFESFQN